VVGRRRPPRSRSGHHRLQRKRRCSRDRRRRDRYPSAGCRRRTAHGGARRRCGPRARGVRNRAGGPRRGRHQVPTTRRCVTAPTSDRSSSAAGPRCLVHGSRRRTGQAGLAVDTENVTVVKDLPTVGHPAQPWPGRDTPIVIDGAKARSTLRFRPPRGRPAVAFAVGIGGRRAPSSLRSAPLRRPMDAHGTRT
jgi:hypothetical protein